MVERGNVFGHFGVRKKGDRMNTVDGVWWAGIEADTNAIVSRCTACTRNAAHRVVYHAAQTIPIPEGIWDRVHMDLLELPVAKDEARYQLLFVDALSKFPVGYALKS